MFALQMLQLVLYHDIHTKLQNVQNDLQSDLFRVQGWLQANKTTTECYKICYNVAGILAEAAKLLCVSLA